MQPDDTHQVPLVAVLQRAACSTIPREAQKLADAHTEFEAACDDG